MFASDNAVPCRVEWGHHAGASGRRAWGGSGASSAQGRPNCGGCWQGTRGAHPKHAVHICDAGRVEAQRLEEGRRAGREAGGRREGGGASSAQGRLNCGGCWQGTRGAHPKHVLHVVDAGRVEAQRLVECRRFLPIGNGSIGRGAPCRPGGGSAWGRRRRKQRAGSTELYRLLTGHARTLNISSILVALDVSKLSGWLNADALCRVEREG
eukprot:scaffold49868_cov57-Phaeocystis_antarctica.AAC.4